MLKSILCSLLGHDTGGCCTEDTATRECVAYCSRCGKRFTGGLRDFITENIRAHEQLSQNVR
jgi:hypothetical protein